MERYLKTVNSLLETGLFQDPPGEDFQLKIVGSNFSLFLDYDSVLWWERYRRSSGEDDYRIVSFEKVLSNVPPSVQEGLLFHLDFFSRDFVSSRK